MENTNGRASFLPNHRYFATTLSDEEDDDNFEYGYQNYLMQNKENPYMKSTWSPIFEKNHSIASFELHSCNRNNKRFRNSIYKSNEATYQKDYSGNPQNLEHIFFSQVQFWKSKACSEASNYSLQQSLKLLMEKNKYGELYNHSIASPHGACKESMQSIVKRSLQIGDRTMKQKIIEPAQKVVTSEVKVEPIHLKAQYKQTKMEHIQITSNVAFNLNAYSKPIDKQKSSSLVNSKVSKYKNTIWTSSKTKVSHSYGSSKLKLHLTNQGELKDCRNPSWNFGPIEKSQTTIQLSNNNKKIVQVNPIDLNTNISSTLPKNNISNYNIASLEENAIINTSKKMKIGISSNKKIKDQILSILNSSRRTQQTIHKTTQYLAYCLDEDKKVVDPKGLHFDILCEQKLETLNVIDYKPLEIDRRTMYEAKDPSRFEVFHVCDEKKIRCNASFGFDVAKTSKKSKIKIKPWKTKGGKENRGQIDINYIPSNLEKNEDIKNKELPTPSSPIEDQRLQISIYDANQHEDNVYNPIIFVKNNSVDKNQVHIKAKEPYAELHLQTIKLLKLLKDLQFQHQTSKICNKETKCMTNPIGQCGYLAQYLKKKKMGVLRNNHLPTLYK